MIIKTNKGQEIHMPVHGNLLGHRIDSVQLSFTDLQKLMRQQEHEVLEWLQKLYGRMV